MKVVIPEGVRRIEGEEEMERMLCGVRLPARVQRQRKRDWKAPDGAVYVGRPTKWANPHKISATMSRAQVLEAFREDLYAGRLAATIEDARRELRGRPLMCWCRLEDPCHADVWLEVANS